MGLAYFKLLIFSDFSSMGVGLENEILSSTSSCKFFYAFSPKLSALRKYYDFESILGVFLFKTGIFQRIEN